MGVKRSKKTKKYVAGYSFAGGKTKVRKATPKGTRDKIPSVKSAWRSKPARKV